MAQEATAADDAELERVRAELAQARSQTGCALGAITTLDLQRVRVEVRASGHSCVAARAYPHSCRPLQVAIRSHQTSKLKTLAQLAGCTVPMFPSQVTSHHAHPHRTRDTV